MNVAAKVFGLDIVVMIDTNDATPMPVKRRVGQDQLDAL